MKRRDDLSKARKALRDAEQQREEVKGQRPFVESETRWLGVLFAENNLAARWRKALTGE